MKKISITIINILIVCFLFPCCKGKKADYPVCKNDRDCKTGEICINGKCQQCKTDQDCPSGIPCIEGRCEKSASYESKKLENELSAGSVSSPYKECNLENIYFDFDSSELKPQAISSLKKVAECLLSKGAKNITIIGHCDPRGTEEYNMGLGLERANAIKRFLISYGIPENEIIVYSKGEEEATGTDEETWALDRKGEFK